MKNQYEKIFIHFLDLGFFNFFYDIKKIYEVIKFDFITNVLEKGHGDFHPIDVKKK